MKISIIGAGFVGATTAHWLALKDFDEIVLCDKIADMAKGKAFDLLQAMPITGSTSKIFGTGDFSDTKNSDLVVITAGIARKPGMSRDELLAINVKITKEVSENVAKTSPNAVIIVVTNPLDAMVYAAWKITGFLAKRVLGMAGILDSARMRTFIAEALNVYGKDVNAMVLGGHGDTMVPLMRLCEVNGTPVAQLLPKEKIDEIVARTQNGGAEIVQLLQAGSAYYAPSAAVAEMAEAILKDQKKILPCAAYLDGEYGVKGLFIGVPAVLGRDGVEKIVEFELNADEKAQFQRTVEHVKVLCAETEKYL